MGQFEQTCAELNIELLLPLPARPKYNGIVGCAKRVFKQDIYYCNDFTVDTIIYTRLEPEKLSTNKTLSGRTKNLAD